MVTTVLDRKTLQEKKGPLENFHRLNATYLTTLWELKNMLSQRTT
jgi:hypothetical protein